MYKDKHTSHTSSWYIFTSHPSHPIMDPGNRSLAPHSLMPPMWMWLAPLAFVLPLDWSWRAAMLGDPKPQGHLPTGLSLQLFFANGREKRWCSFNFYPHIHMIHKYTMSLSDHEKHRSKEMTSIGMSLLGWIPFIKPFPEGFAETATEIWRQRIPRKLVVDFESCEVMHQVGEPSKTLVGRTWKGVNLENQVF